jgi:predicted NAD/FAD-binding protein
MSQYPARFILQSLGHIMAHRQMVRFAKGTGDFADQLAKGLNVISGSPVVEVENEGGKLVVKNARGESVKADHVITAVQANHLGVLGKVVAPSELSLLERLSFDRGEIVCHQDESLMPKNKRDWCVLNYRMNRELTEDSFTVWVNPIEPSLNFQGPVFQTWNPPKDRPIAKVLGRTMLERSVVTGESEKAWEAIKHMAQDPTRHVHYCGSWSYPGVPLLESAVRSAVRVAKHLGATIPWTLEEC